MPVKIPPAIEALFGPIADAFGDVLKKSLTAAVDTALEEAEERVNDVGDRIRRTRKKTRRKAASDEPEAPSRVRRR
jgi:hypothetical protein